MDIRYLSIHNKSPQSRVSRILVSFLHFELQSLLLLPQLPKPNLELKHVLLILLITQVIDLFRHGVSLNPICEVVNAPFVIGDLRVNSAISRSMTV